LNFDTGLQYPLVSQAPQYRMTSLETCRTCRDHRDEPTSRSRRPGDDTRGMGPRRDLHRDTQNIIDIYGAAQDRDLGAINDDINAAIANSTASCPRAAQSP